MPIIRWIFGIILAAALTLGVAVLMLHYFEVVDVRHLTATEQWMVNIFLSLAFGLFIFLSCVFVPSHKKYAAWMAFALSAIFIGLGTYHHVEEDGYLAGEHLMRYTCFVTSLLIFFFISYYRFRPGTGW